MSTRWVKLEEAADMLGTGPEGVLTLIRFRELPVALHSAQVLVWRDAVEAKVRASKAAILSSSKTVGRAPARKTSRSPKATKEAVR